MGPSPPKTHSYKLQLANAQANANANYAREQSELQHELSATAPAPAQAQIKAQLAANQAAFVAQQEALQKKQASLQSSGMLDAKAPEGAVSAPSSAPAPTSRHLLQARRRGTDRASPRQLPFLQASVA